jgi:hypothetical protein
MLSLYLIFSQVVRIIAKQPLTYLYINQFLTASVPVHDAVLVGSGVSLNRKIRKSLELFAY